MTKWGAPAAGRAWALPPHLCKLVQVSAYGDLSPYFGTASLPTLKVCLPACPATHTTECPPTSCRHPLPSQLPAILPLIVIILTITIPNLQAALSNPDLWAEVALLERMVYKNRSQHRGSHLLQHTHEVLAAVACPALGGLGFRLGSRFHFLSYAGWCAHLAVPSFSG